MAVLTLSKDDKENIVRKLFNPAITSEYISDSWAHRIGETRHTFAEDLIHALAFDDYLDALQGLEEDEKLELLTMLKHDTSPNLPIPRWQEFLTRQVMPRDCSRLSNIMGLGDHGISKNLIKSIILPALIPPPGQQGPRPPPSFRAAQQLLTPEGSPAPTEALSSLVVVSNAAVQINDRLDSTYFSHDTGSSSAAEDEANTTAIQPLKSVDPAQDLSGSSTISENSILSGISSDDLDVDMKMENADTPIEVVIIGHDANANENLVGQSVGDYLPDVTSPSTVQIFHSAREGAISGASTTSPLTQVTEHGRSVSPRARVYRLDIQQPADAIDVTPSRRAASPRVIIDMPPPEVLSQFQSMAMPTRQSPRGSKRAICAEEPIDGSSAEDEISSDDGEGEDEKPDNAGGERGSSKADSSSSLDELSRSPTPFEWRKDSSEDEMEGSRANRTPKRSSKKRKRTSMTSDHFESPTPTKRKRQKTKTTRRVPAGQSAVVFPPTTADSFGIVQERLWQDPFSLIIAVLFLNKTAGKSSMPVFREVIKKYPTPEALSKANWDELFEMVKSLGLQTQRTTKLIKLANHWVDKPPEVGVRYRTLHYPAQGDGKQWRPSHVEGDAEDCAGALEIGKLPGCGRYARDSWRIFCRDVFRGVASDYNGKDAVEGFEAEWKRVLPEDKELRAFLRWMWLKEGFVWDETTGEKHAAGPDLLEKARLGQTEWTIRETTAASEERTGGSDLEQPESPVLPGSSTGALLAVDDEVNPEEPDNQLLPESDPGISDDGVNLEEPDNQLLPEDRPGRASRAAIADVQLTQHSDATQIPVLVGTANAEDQACPPALVANDTFGLMDNSNVTLGDVVLPEDSFLVRYTDDPDAYDHVTGSDSGAPGASTMFHRLVRIDEGLHNGLNLGLDGIQDAPVPSAEAFDPDQVILPPGRTRAGPFHLSYTPAIRPGRTGGREASREESPAMTPDHVVPSSELPTGVIPGQEGMATRLAELLQRTAQMAEVPVDRVPFRRSPTNAIATELLEASTWLPLLYPPPRDAATLFDAYSLSSSNSSADVPPAIAPRHLSGGMMSNANNQQYGFQNRSSFYQPPDQMPLPQDRLFGPPIISPHASQAIDAALEHTLGMLQAQGLDAATINHRLNAIVSARNSPSSQSHSIAHYTVSTVPSVPTHLSATPAIFPGLPSTQNQSPADPFNNASTANVDVAPSLDLPLPTMDTGDWDSSFSWDEFLVDENDRTSGNSSPGRNE